MNPFPLARILNLLFFLIAVICCFPVVLVLLLLLWFTGRLGLARSFVSGRTVFADFSRHHTAFPPPRQSPEEDQETIDVEVIRAETVSEEQDSSSPSQNRLP